MDLTGFFLVEDRNTHLEHLEDEVINNGSQGIKDAVEFLKSFGEMLSKGTGGRSSFTVKWDGAPAIICGTNPENGKFFVGTKSVFNVTPKINYTNRDIDKNHSGGLATRLKVALAELKKLNISGVLQGDMLYIKGDLKTENIDQVAMTTFTPNTITYAVPVDSDIGRQIRSSQMGIVFHTTYRGKTIDSMKASFGANVRGLRKVSSVFFDDATFKNVTGIGSFTPGEQARFDGILRMALGSASKGGRLADKLKGQSNVLSIGIQLKTFFNSFIRGGQSISGVKKLVDDFQTFFKERLDKEIDARKTEASKQKYKMIQQEGLNFIKKYAGDFYFVIATYVSLQAAKTFLIRKVNQIQGIGTFLRTENGFRVTSPEGFVAIKGSKAVKLVDRLEFSRANFTVAKDWARG